MSTEAFIMNYRDGDVEPLSFRAIRKIFDMPGTVWSSDYNSLTIPFHDPDDSVEMFCGGDPQGSGVVSGVTIVRPIVHPEFLKRLYQLMKLSNVMLFYSDDTTPIFYGAAAMSHYPNDLIEALGEPRTVNSPNELRRQS